MSLRTHRARQLALTSYALLLGQQGLDALLNQAPWFIWALKLGPLLLFLPGMYRDNLRSYIWLCFVSNMYFVVLVQRIFAQPGSPLVITGLVAVVLLFTFAMLYVRWRARDLKAAAAQPENEP
jgi:uncharacterized membrane protein